MTSCIPRTLLAWLAALLACAAAPSAVAQDYPSKPIRVIVPWPAGGLVDIAARAVATRLQAGLAQTVIVDNKVGAGGLIGADQGAKATPDGYTLVLTTSALTINTAMRTLNDTVQHTITSLREVTAVAEDLRGAAGLLNEEIGKFRLED